jgi:tyrosine-protein kinase Etk/Wzc
MNESLVPGHEANDGDHLPAHRASRSEDVDVPRPESLEDDVIDLRDIWMTLKRRKWTILAALALVMATVATYTFLVTPVWYASTLIRVDDPQQTALVSPELSALVGLPGGSSQIETELRILRTRPIAEEVVDRHDLHFVVTRPRRLPRELLFASLEFGRETAEHEYEIRMVSEGRYRVRSADEETPPLTTEFSPGERVELPGGSFVLRDLASGTSPTGDPIPTRVDIETLSFQKAVNEFLETLSASRPDREANVLQVGYRTTDRSLVHQVPNTHAERFIERRIESQKTEARGTVAFLEGEVEQTRQQLEDVEAHLQQFREGEQIVAVEAEAEAQVERLATLQTRRTQLDAERAALAGLLADIEIDSSAENPDYRRLASFPTFFQNQAVTGMLGSLIQADSARAALATRMTPSHPDVIAIEERITQLEGQLGSIGRNYLGSLSDQIGALDAVLAQFGAELETVPERQIQFARIQRQVGMLAQLYTVLQTRLKEAEVQEAIDDSSVRIVEHAIEPLEPVSPKPVRNLALAMMLGLVLGVVLAFVREYMDGRLHSSDRIEALYGLPTMARVPRMALGDGRDDRKAALVALDDTLSLGAESFRNLRTNVRFVRKGRRGDELVVTSPSTGEGKSLTAANLAITLAQQGRPTLLLDADMRRPVQHTQFDAAQVPGLSDCLLADELLEGVIRPTMLDSLFVLPSGSQPPNPAELLDSPQMDRLLEALRTCYDAVIIDSPPVLAVTDSAVLAPKTDGVILVVRAEKTDRDAIALAIQQLRQVDAEILGIVVNDAKAEGSYHSYYKEYYGEKRATGFEGLVVRIKEAFS